MANYKIITSVGELELNDNFGFGVNISISDLSDIAKKNSNFTKSIVLPGTKANNKILGDLFDINSTFTFFNPNFKIDAKIVINSTTVIDGFIQLLEIKKLNTSDLQGNYIQYSVNLSDNVIDFYTLLKDKELTDLDLSSFNHVLTRANIEASWLHTNSTEGYVYPLYYNGQTTHDTQDFKPSIFHKAYLTALFDGIGYSLGGSLLDDPIYNKEIIPFNGEIIEIDATEVTRRKFRASSTASSTVQTINFNGNSILNGGNVNLNVLDNDSTAPNFDNGGVFNTATSEWTVDTNGKFDLNYNFDFNLSWSVPSAVETWKNDGNVFNNLNSLDTYSISVALYVNNVIITTVSPVSQIVPTGVGVGSTFNAGNSYTVDQSFTTSGLINSVQLNIGDVAEFKIRVKSNNIVNYRDTANTTGGAFVPIDVLVSNPIGSTFYNNPLSGFVTDGDTVAIANYIPKDIKQSDFLNDVITRYNLIIRTDPTNNKRILLDSKDAYYAAGGSVDWTNKKDFSNEDNIKLLSDLQSKEIIFSYKEDDDDFNENYTEGVDGSTIYGQKKITFANEFVKGTKKIETIFSPTPLIYNSASKEYIVSSIPTNNPAQNIRVLYWGGLLSGNFTINSVDSGTPTTTNYSTYPYAGHFDNPTLPTIDINFGLNNFYFYSDIASVTNNNGYNRYWKNTIQQIAEGRLLSSKFYLNEVDINFIKDNLNTKIWVKDAYYYINKIIDYNPLSNDLTKVELIKIVEGVEFIAEEEVIPIVLTAGEANDIATTFNTLPNYTTNNYNGSYGSGVVGDDNIIGAGSDGSEIVGSNNRIAENSPNTNISGDNNLVGNDSTNIIIQGSNNTVLPNIENSGVIGANDKTITQSNEFYIGNLHIVDGVALEGDTQYETSNYKVLSTDAIIYVDSSGGAFTVTLEDNPALNKEVQIIDSVGSCGAFTVAVSGGLVNIIGLATYSMTQNYESIRLIFNGAQWNLI